MRERISLGIEGEVLEAVRRRNPTALNVLIQSVQTNFLGGELYTVAFDLPGDEPGPHPAYNNRVYVKDSKLEVYGTDQFLLEILGAKHNKSLFDFLANSNIVSGIIALIVTLMIVPTFLIANVTSSPVPVPDWITSGWLLILGFYFGKASGRRD